MPIAEGMIDWEETQMAYDVIVHHADGECSTEGTHEHRDLAMWQAIELAKQLDARREWVHVAGFIVRGRKVTG